MTKHVLAMMFLLAFTAAMALADAGQNKYLPDQSFATKAYRSNLMEQRLAEVALQKSSNQDVKNYAQMLITGHKGANDQLFQLSQTGNFTLPQGLTSHEQKVIDHFSKLNGPDFDKRFIRYQIRSHERNLSDFRSESQNGQEPNLKSYATKMLPHLEEHLRMAQQIAPKVGAKAS